MFLQKNLIYVDNIAQIKFRCFFKESFLIDIAQKKRRHPYKPFGGRMELDLPKGS